VPIGSLPLRRALIRVAYACLVAIVFEAACAVFVIFVLPGFKPYYFTDFYDRKVAGISDAQIADFARHRHDEGESRDRREVLPVL